MTTTLRILVESTPKKVFASALDWPGLARSGRDEASALDTLRAYARRYQPIAARAGHALGADDLDILVAERMPGDAGTAYGVPSQIAGLDRAPVSQADALRMAALVEAAWGELGQIAAAAPEELRKGPRGGGRDRSKMVRHVIDAEASYAAVLGRKHSPVDDAALAAMRADLLSILRQPSDGSPVAGRKWPARYAARRIAWHVLDHAWEIEDRSTPG